MPPEGLEQLSHHQGIPSWVRPSQQSPFLWPAPERKEGSNTVPTKGHRHRGF